MKKILVTGASGFVGKKLIQYLLENTNDEIFALTRSQLSIQHPRLKLVQGDLLKFKSLPKLENIDYAFYLVHGLKEASRDFEHLEDKMCINFLNWLSPFKPRGITYLGGLVPNDETPLSPHLRSRVQTGDILRLSPIPSLEFRASIILGADSISFEIIKALSHRLPVLPRSPRLNSPAEPLALSDLLKYLVASIGLEHIDHKIVEIGCGERKTYTELLTEYCQIENLKKITIDLPDLDPSLINPFLDYLIPEYKQVGKKLFESIECSTICTNNLASQLFSEIHPKSLKDAFLEAKSHSNSTYAPLWDKDFYRIVLEEKLKIPYKLMKQLEDFKKRLPLNR